jgi:hypothetical protein
MRRLAFLLGSVALGAGAPVWAQDYGDVPLTVGPGSDAPAGTSPAAGGDGSSDPAAPQAEAAPASSAAPGADPASGEAGADETGFYHYDGTPQRGDDDAIISHNNTAVPEVHVVKSGDTLWDICGYYYNNSWEWPRVWSYNPTITNPHWIYPGDLVRLAPARATPLPVPAAAPDDPELPSAQTPPPVAAPAADFRLRQLAFVESEQIERSFVVAGAEEPRVMLSQHDVVYLDYPEEQIPQVGRRYAVYSDTKPVKHPTTGETVGAYVWVLGELEVLSVKKGKKARAVIRDANDVIERGARVGPLRRTFQRLDPVQNQADKETVVVALLNGDELIGARQLVIVDVGGRDGVKRGNRMFVVRQGDAATKPLARQVGRGDESFPAYAIAEILVVDVGETTSVGLVTLSIQESEVGDRVIMRKGR